MRFRILRGQRPGSGQVACLIILAASAVYGRAQQPRLDATITPVANFTDVAEKAGLTMQEIFGGVSTKKYIIETTGTGQGVCVGDYDNDGWEDLYVTDYGKNRLYHNQGGVFTEVAEKAGVAGTGKAWGTGCAFIDYDRDG